MIQVEIIENYDLSILVEDINCFLEELDDYHFVDIKYSSFYTAENAVKSIKYSVLIIYKVD